MALVDDRTMTPNPEPPEGDGRTLSIRRTANGDKQVFLVAAFRRPDSAPPGFIGRGLAEDVVAVIGVDRGSHRFEWVGDDEADSISRPALINPVPIEVALPSPWHPEHEQVLTGLVPLSPGQLGDGSLNDDITMLLSELAATR